MKRVHDLERRLHSLHMLQEAVSAMKSLAAHHLREARAGLDAAHAYKQGVERVGRQVGMAIPAGDGPGGLLIIGAELGLCGSYNSQVADVAMKHRTEHGLGPTFVMGRRVATLVERRGIPDLRRYRAPTVSKGITDALLVLIQDVLGAYLKERMAFLDVVATPFAGVGRQKVEVTRLLPLSLHAEANAARVFYNEPNQVSQAAARELLYSTMYGVLLDALAAEHGARLAATQAADRWLGERVEGLKRALASVRREAGTQEVIEIATGARRRLA